MIDRTQKELESRRPSIDAAEAVRFCLMQLYRDKRHAIKEDVCHHLTYEELIGALLLARDIVGVPVKSRPPYPQVMSPKVACPVCLGTGQDDPPPGKYHGICAVCNGTGSKKDDVDN